FHADAVLYRRHHKQKHYDILQVQRHADKKTIKAQYYRLSKLYHPDMNPHDKSAHEKFLEVNDAYAVLGNEASRRQYDAE
ncbi:DnaJ-domain-containing protein, partial [Hesseltinella vesiculosa]